MGIRHGQAMKIGWLFWATTQPLEINFLDPSVMLGASNWLISSFDEDIRHRGGTRVQLRLVFWGAFKISIWYLYISYSYISYIYIIYIIHIIYQVNSCQIEDWVTTTKTHTHTHTRWRSKNLKILGWNAESYSIFLFAGFTWKIRYDL